MTVYCWSVPSQWCLDFCSIRALIAVLQPDGRRPSAELSKVLLDRGSGRDGSECRKASLGGSFGIFPVWFCDHGFNRLVSFSEERSYVFIFSPWRKECLTHLGGEKEWKAGSPFPFLLCFAAALGQS